MTINRLLCAFNKDKKPSSRLFVAFLIFLGIILGKSYLAKDSLGEQTMKVVFPDLHFDRNWNISDGSSLWNVFILNNITETLIRVGNNSDLVPALASSWALSDDKKILKLFLSKDRTFHNGKPIMPKDILISLKRSFLSSSMKHSEIHKFLIGSNLDKAISLKGNELEIKLKYPLNALIYKLSIPEMGIAPQDYAQNKTHKESLKNLSGPYKVIDFQEKKLSLKKYSKHPLVQKKSPDQVDIIEIQDSQKSIEYYKNNENVVLIGSGYANALEYINLTGEKYISSPAFTEFFLSNIDSENLNSIEKRRTVFSILKKAFSKVKINTQIAEKTDQIFTKNNLARLNEKEVKSLYRENTNNAPQKLTLLLFGFMQNSPVPSLIQNELKKLGTELNIIEYGKKGSKDIFKNKKYDLLYVYSGVTALDPIVEFIYLFNHPVTNFSYQNKILSKILEEIKIETDRKKYTESLKKLHLGLLESYRILPLMHTRMIYFAKGDYQLKELSYFDGGFNLWDWYKK